ncbi:MAG: DUF6285 domain-containing protein [Hyphomicrobiaceae bacterium]
MTTRRVDPDALLDLANETLRSSVLAALPPAQRYAGAMIANALEIARRGLPGEVEAAEWVLLDDLYDDGEGSIAQLARDIRAGSLPQGKVAELAESLRTLLIAELRVTNPKFLASRGVAG